MLSQKKHTYNQAVMRKKGLISIFYIFCISVSNKLNSESQMLCCDSFFLMDSSCLSWQSTFRIIAYCFNLIANNSPLATLIKTKLNILVTIRQQIFCPEKKNCAINLPKKTKEKERDESDSITLESSHK